MRQANPRGARRRFQRQIGQRVSLRPKPSYSNTRTRMSPKCARNLHDGGRQRLTTANIPRGGRSHLVNAFQPDNAEGLDGITDCALSTLSGNSSCIRGTYATPCFVCNTSHTHGNNRTLS
ncbi:hypothetical protein Trydic_g22623 [Trypoxylus dichotomus]